jgi:hypothetical protein
LLSLGGVSLFIDLIGCGTEMRREFGLLWSGGQRLQLRFGFLSENGRKGEDERDCNGRELNGRREAGI